MALVPAPVDALAAAREALAAFEPAAAERGIGLAASGEPAPALADPTALQRVLSNLIDNAVKFTDRGGVSVRIMPAGETVEVRIADTGVGIDEAFLPRLFDEFTQASDGYARTHEGIGLGLPVVRRLVALMSGTIDVQSRPGLGTVVTVRLPSSAALPAAARSKAAAPPSGASAVPPTARA